MVAAQLDLTTTSTMLSAFAARKKAVPSIQTDQNIISDSDSQLEEPSPLLQAPTKRKQNCNEDSVPPRKRKKRNQMSANSNYSRTISTSSVEPVGTRVSRGYSPSGPIEVEEESLGATNQPTLISTFEPLLDRNVFFDFHGGSSSTVTAIYLVFKSLDTLSFFGTVSLTVLQGSILLFGSALHASSVAHSVFAPKSYPMATVSVLSDQVLCSQPQPLPEKIKDIVTACDVVIKLEDLKSGIQSLADICGDRNILFEALPEFKFNFKLHEFFPIQRNGPSLTPFVVPPSWEEVLSLAELTEDTPTVLIKGPKNSGKSMFSRMLVNRMLLRYKYVAYIDCDIGQTEFTPPGMVSLHILRQPILGPPYTHPRQPFRAHFVGSTSIRSSTGHFLACVDALLESYRLDVRHTYELEHDCPGGSQDGEASHTETQKHIPLVINTFGWVKGIGADALYHIEARANLTHIISLEPTSSDPVWTLPSREHSAKVNYLPIEGVEDTRQEQTQANKRALMIMSYFHHEGAINEHRKQDGSIKWVTHKPLCAQIPWEVTWETAIDKIILIGSGAEDIVQSELLRVLNGAIVALVTTDLHPPGRSPSPKRNKWIPYEQGTEAPPPNASDCLGVALVRSVRPSNGTIHIITPISPSLLVRCRQIVMGEVRLPVWGMLDHRPESRSAGQIAGIDSSLVPFLDWGKGQQSISGSKTLRVRRNLMRKSQV